ncbi:MAG: tetratricopeptide repeat protein [Ignavibacteriae bacterium]|nr:tetratricopeptide repeat protein [Ignavibacteriota bacterium]
MKSILVISSLLTLLLVGCSKPSPEEYMAKAKAARDSSNFTLALEQYEELIANHPKSFLAEEAMFSIASIKSDNLHEFSSAVQAYKRVYETYPDGKRAPLAMFLVGYLNNNEIHDLASAKQAYEDFLAKYPDHEMAVSARFELQNLGKRPEELLPSIQDTAKPQIATEPKKSSKKK